MDVQRYFLVNVVCFLEFVISPPPLFHPKREAKDRFRGDFPEQGGSEIGYSQKQKKATYPDNPLISTFLKKLKAPDTLRKLSGAPVFKLVAVGVGVEPTRGS